MSDSADNARESHPRTDQDSFNVLIVDDHPVVCEILEEILKDHDEFEVCGTVSTVEEGLEAIDTMKPSVIVVDILLSRSNGFNLIEEVDRMSDVEAIVFSMFDEKLYAERALRAGARAYVMKSEPTQKVIEAIEAARDGDVYLSADLRNSVLEHTFRSSNRSPAFAIDTLTDRERTICKLLGGGMDIDEIAQKLDLSEKTVEVYRRRAKDKLGLDSTTELLQFAIEWTYYEWNDGSRE